VYSFGRAALLLLAEV